MNKVNVPEPLLEAEPLLDPLLDDFLDPLPFLEPLLCLDPLLVEDRLPVFPDRVDPRREFDSDPLSLSNLPVEIGTGTGTTAATPPGPALPLLLFNFAAKTA